MTDWDEMTLCIGLFIANGLILIGLIAWLVTTKSVIALILACIFSLTPAYILLWGARNYDSIF